MNKYFFKRSFVLLVIIFINLCYYPVLAQTKKDLQLQKKKTEQEIAYANKLLKQTKQRKKTGYNLLIVINKKIEIQNQLIETTNNEINLLDNEILHLQDTVNNLEDELNVLKDEFAKLLRQSYKQKSKYDILLYIFSSEDLNQAYNRLKYVQQYDKYRDIKANEIKEKQKTITEKLELLSLNKAEKLELLKDNVNLHQKLTNDKQSKSELIIKLKQKESTLRKEIKKKRIQAKKIDDEIQRIIELEIRKAEELARKNAKENLLLKLTPEEKLISENFEENKNRLPWPTKYGIITSNFGIHPHPVLKGVNIENNGIDISTTEGSYARAIFKGKVAAISYIEGINNIVIIKHGNYYSVYANLVDVLVKVNEEVKEKQRLGKIFTDSKNENKTYINFQVWKDKQKLDPKAWIAKYN